MVGKIKRARQKLHHGAVRIETENCSPAKLEKTHLNVQSKELKPIIKPPVLPGLQNYVPKPTGNPQDLKAFNFPKGIFADTTITPDVLVQTLKVNEPSPVAAKLTAEEPKGQEEKKQQSKKEKMKERRERWLNKISAFKVSREQQSALKRRQSTPVVGDMRVLVDALPELSSITENTTLTQRRKQGPVKKRKAEPTDYFRMKQGQKRKLLETEMSRFKRMMKDPAFKANPLAVIGEHLRKSLRQEDEQS
ncbi:ribosome biogenesis protein SLX9 homolog [Hoplias malabaricus]|uniref:ribosome biogenesis protein SLX9 homolog n=1 Tax=Hoplias malabaricus TaxID=27720 RepID=UPI0034636BA4